MTAALHLARPEDADRLDAIVAACHAEMGLTPDPEARRAALAPLLDGSPYGAAYLVGPTRAPVGFIIVTFSWSLAAGGLEGTVDQLYVRPPVRGRGIATEVLLTLPPALAEAGLCALHLRISPDDDRVRRLCARSGFAGEDGYVTMTRRLS